MDVWRPGADGGDWALGDDLMQMLTINAGEWLIARGSIDARGGLRPINEYLLSGDGPYLTPGQQRWIAQLRERTLWLYRVTDVRLEEGMTLVDALDPTPNRSSCVKSAAAALPGPACCWVPESCGWKMPRSRCTSSSRGRSIRSAC